MICIFYFHKIENVHKHLEQDRGKKDHWEIIREASVEVGPALFFDYKINREEAARYGLTVGDVQDVIMTAIGGLNITETVEGLVRYSVNLRYGFELRDSPEKLRRILVPTPSGAQIPITQVADITIHKGAPSIKSENARKNAWVYVDTTGGDVGGYVERVQQAVADKIDLPPGYSIVWSGHYEYMVRAQQKLKIVVPATLIIIFLLLYLNFNNITEFLQPCSVSLSSACILII